MQDIPRRIKRQDSHALEDPSNRRSNRKETHDGQEEVDGISIESLWHNSQVEEEDGGFVQGNRHLVCDLEDPVELSCVLSAVHVATE